MSNTHGEWLDRIRGSKRKEKSRLIDTDALEVVTAKVPKGMDAKSYMAGMEYVLGQIDAMPTIEERKKGEWVKEYWNGEYTRKCSACNITQTVTTYRGKVNFNYCPYCGADMRGEQDAAD